MAPEKVSFLFFSMRFKPHTHASITLASRIPLSKRDCNHRYHRRLVYRCYYLVIIIIFSVAYMRSAVFLCPCNARVATVRVASRRATETRAWRNRLLESSDQGRLNASNRGIRVLFEFFKNNRICEGLELVFWSYVCLMILQFQCTLIFCLKILHGMLYK